MPGPQVTVSDVDAAWAAGVLDCDGHIGVHWQKPNPKRREINGRWRLKLQVTGTIMAIPERMAELFGGHLHYRKTSAGTPCCYWGASQRIAERCLLQVLPHLVGKHELAQRILSERCLLESLEVEAA